MFFSLNQGLKVIKGIAFTSREIDVIACILNNRGTKKTAFILSIAPRTVETHTRNIILKLECNSREGVIDFVESSEEFPYVKEHYYYLLIESKFTGVLKKIDSMTTATVICCVDLRYVDDEKIKSIEKLITYMNLAHITISKDMGSNVSREKGKNSVHTLYPY